MNAVVAPVAYQRQSNGNWNPVAPSPDGTVFNALSTAPIIDAAGNSWTIGANGVVAVNGAPDLSTFGVVALEYVGGKMWQSNGTVWYSKDVPIWTAGEGPFAAVLSWTPPTTNADGTPITELTGYVVSYGLSPTALTNSASVAVPSLSLPVLAPGTWYFAVAAVNSFGVKSANSNIVSKTI
jgi:hypothetical protein